jgi:hypothetical protein
MQTQLSTLQDFPYAEGLQAVKDSLRFEDFASFYPEMVNRLPQNSPVTRKRYANLVTRWFFPERRLGGLLPTVWRTYGDDQLLREVARVTTLEIEPVIAHFVTDVILPLPPGTPFSRELTRNYVTATYGAFKENSYKRLQISVAALGYLRGSKSTWSVAALPPPADALLILLHARLAPTPRIVRLADLLVAPLWRYLGLRSDDDVRHILRDAAAAGLLARYTTVDQLEQITTRYTYTDYLNQRLRL